MTNDLQLNLVYEQIIEGVTASNYAVSDCFFDTQEIEELRKQIFKKYAELPFKEAAIGKQEEEKVLKIVRSDSILWIDEAHKDPVESLFFRKINDFIAYLNQTCYLGLGGSEFHYAVYPPETFYKRHLDVFQRDQRRALSIVLYLNDECCKEEYGGQLNLFLSGESGEEQVVEIAPTLGRLVVFDSRKIEHEVRKVKRTRYSITGWLKTQGATLAI